MNSVLLIVRHEFLTTIRRRSYAVAVFGLPLIAAAIILVRSLVAGSSGAVSEFALPKAPAAPQGYVDHLGLLTTVPEPLAPAFVAYASEEEANQATAQDAIDGYFVIGDDFLDSGELIYYSREFNPLGAEARAQAFPYLVTVNLVDDPQLAALLWEPASLTEIALQARESTATGDIGSYWLPYAILIMFLVSLSMSSGWLLSSVTNEKDTRMLEVMLSSVSPFEMLLGKTIGLGAVGLLQVVVWLFASNLLLRLSGGLALPAGLEIGTSTLAWGLLFFLFGYALYAALVAGLGALAPSLRDASQATFLLYIPLMLPLWFVNSIITRPNGALALILSIFPFTAPVAMIARVARVSPPAWQLLLAAVLLLVAAYGTMRLVARLFRAQILLSGQSLSLARLRAAMTLD
mgnify:CR=1 FL=1